MRYRKRKKSTRKGQPRKTAKLAYSSRAQGRVQRVGPRRRRRQMKRGNPIGTQHTKELQTVLAIAAGGSLAGLVEGMQDRGQLPDIPGNIEPSLLVGAALVGIPVFGKMKGKTATYAALLGSGMLAAAAKEYVSNAYAPAEVAVQTAAELAE